MAKVGSDYFGEGGMAYRCRSLWIISFWILLVTRSDFIEGLDCPISPVIVNNSDIVAWSVPVFNGASPVHLNSTHQPGGYFALGNTSVTYTATITAPNGTTTTERCSFVVRIIPDGSPVISFCPGDQRYETLPINYWDDISNIPTAAGCGQSGGDCVTKSRPQPGNDFQLGTTKVIYRFTNTTAGLTSRCSFKVTITGLSNTVLGPSVMNCPPSDLPPVVVVPRGTQSTVATWGEPLFTDTNGAVLPSLGTKPPGSPFPEGSTEVLYVAMDTNFQRGLCLFNVTVIVDDIPPDVQCPENITMYVREGVAGLEVNWPPPNAIDNSGTITMTVQPESGTFFRASIGGQMEEIAVNVYDDYGNSANCSFFVNIISDTTPQVQCPDIMPETRPGEAYADVTWPDANITDDYIQLSMLMVASTHQSGLRVRYDDPVVVVTITVRDERQNEGLCTFDIDVLDNEKPTWIGCPNDTTKAATPRSNQVVVEWTLPTATDNSGEDPITSGPHNDLLLTAGTHLVVYSATDRSGNSAKCEFNVTVTVDSTVPVFTNCPSALSFNTEPVGSDSAFVTWQDVTATDDDSTPTITSNYASGQRLTIGSYDIEYRAIDESGNVAICPFTVTVVDGENPRFTYCPPEDITVNILATEDTVLVIWTTPLATDNSGSVDVRPMTGRIPPGSRFANGTYVIPYIAEDQRGNTATSCQVTVKVAVKAETIRIGGQVILDTVRGLNGAFDDSSARLSNLENDLDDYFRYLNPLMDYFVGITVVPSTRFNSENNAVIAYGLFLCDPSHTNEAEIEEAFTSILSRTNSFPTGNRVVEGSFHLFVKKFRGEFTLMRIDDTNAPVDFEQCCSNPLSGEYSLLKERVNRQLYLMFMDMTGFLIVSVVRFDPGSIDVTFSLTFDQSSPASETDVTSQFTSDVTMGTLELTANGVSSTLYLADSTPLIRVTEVCSDPTPCLNGGSCTVNASTFNDTCTCLNGYTGRYCEEVQPNGIPVSTGGIIGIVLGIMSFFLILMLLCCCYISYFTRLQNKQKAMRGAMREYGWEQQHGSLIPMIAVEDPYSRRYGDRGYDDRASYDNRAGPVITEIENEGPVFHHPTDAIDRPPVPLHLSSPSPTPSPHHPFVDPYRAPIPIPRAALPGPRFGHEYFDAERCMRPNSMTQPGPVSRLRPRGYDREQHEYFQQIRDGFFRSRSKRRSGNAGPRFNGDDRPEEIGEMKHRLFHEFNY